MTRFLPIAILLLASNSLLAEEPTNPQIDYPGFLKEAAKVAKLRKERRIGEDEFLSKSRQANTVILDARSRQKYQMLHVKDAKNLPFPDFTQEELAKIIPSLDTPVLIYCNNNFKDEQQAFPSKLPVASLNIHTFNAMHNYGYTNVYELAPLLKVESSKLKFTRMVLKTSN